VAWGLAHRELNGIEALGVDEVQWQKGHKYGSSAESVGTVLGVFGG
jgi:hypothetical protein